MMMLVYGIVSGVSIGKLFIAGILPGILLASLLIVYTMIRCIINPSLAPKSEEKYTWEDRLKTIPQLAPVVILILMVLGSIYTGFATPTEAAAVGVLGALLFAFMTNSMDLNIYLQRQLWGR
jgi:TRAP-type mannitol/chloroaromatic compound transport system permease large subunit